MDKNKIVKENLDNNIKTEVQLMRQVEHPYIVRLVEVLATSKKILLVMEYIDGGDLFDAIKAEPYSRFKEDKVRPIFQQIVMGINYCHSVNILHRDLKPENILVDKKTKSIKISDFGLSQSIDNKNQIISDIAGTTSYLAPEVIQQTGYLGQSADIWSTGVILYNCVTGTFPFFAKEKQVLLNLILEGNVTYPDYLSAEIVDLLKNIFVVDPKYRYSIEQIIAHTWFQKNLNTVFKNLEKHNINLGSLTLHKSLKKIKNVNTVYDFDFATSSTKGISFDPDNITTINIVELIAMFSSNYVSNIFDKNKSSLKNFDKTNFKFTINTEIEKALNIIFNFFTKDKESEFLTMENGRYVIYYRNNKTLLQIYLNIYKVNFMKYMCTININNGDKEEFQKIMKNFFENNKIKFTLF